jgi:hypothetical protein
MLLAFAVSPTPLRKPSMPAVFDKLGIRFLYPDNWTLDEQEAISGNRSVTVYSPGGAFWSIAVYGPEVDPSELATEALRSIKADYAGAEAEPASDEIAGQTLKGYDLNFFFLDMTNTALIRVFRWEGLTCLVLCQAEDREFKTIGPVFHAITTSLFTNPPVS